jgi:hypothetical protein
MGAVGRAAVVADVDGLVGHTGKIGERSVLGAPLEQLGM